MTNLARLIFPTLCGLLAASSAAARPAPAPAPPAPARVTAPAIPSDPNRLAPAGAAAPAPQLFRSMPVGEDEDMVVGVGMVSVTGHFARENRGTGREPLIGTGGRQTRVAAVGFSLRF